MDQLSPGDGHSNRICRRTARPCSNGVHFWILTWFFFYFHFGISASFCVITWDICNFWVHYFPLHYRHRAFIINFIMHLISTMNSTRVLIFVMDESFSDWPIPVCLSRALNLLPFWPSVVIFLYMAKLFYAFFCLGLCSIIKDFWMFQQL